MSFDDDAAGDGAGFRPPPHPDDRLWRHPSELAGARHAGFVAASRPRSQPRWPWGVVVAVGTMGVVVLTLGGALVLGLRSQVGDVETGPEMAATTTSGQALTAVAPPAWLGIEGADQLMSAGGGQSPSSTGDELIEPSPHEAGAIGDPGGRPLDPDAGEDDDPQTDTSTTTGPDAPTGVVITSVDPNGPSAQALQPGDVVLEVDGEPVTDMETLLTKLGAYQPGDQVEITYKASATGDVQTTSTAVVTLGARPEGLSVEGSAGQ